MLLMKFFPPLRFFILLALLLLLPLIDAAGEMVPGPAGWKIDSEYGFSIGFFTQSEKSGTPIETVKPFAFSQPYAADINNINLQDFMNLGFNLPSIENPQQKKFFIKLYEFPQKLKHFRIIGAVPADFGLNKITGGSAISTFMANRSNLVLKKGFIDSAERSFTETNPFPPLHIYSETPDEQQKFADSIIFYSLYLQPMGVTETEATDAAVASTLGVTSFHQQLIAAFTSSWPQIEQQKDNSLCFVKERTAQRLVLLRVMTKPLIFADNWKNLPMPHGSDRFLTSLLLVSNEVYRSDRSVDANTELDAKTIDQNWKLQKKVIMEIGSIYKHPTK
jgi:hypothetical protein